MTISLKLFPLGIIPCSREMALCCFSLTEDEVPNFLLTLRLQWARHVKRAMLVLFSAVMHQGEQVRLQDEALFIYFICEKALLSCLYGFEKVFGAFSVMLKM